MSDALNSTDYAFLQTFLRDRIGHELGEQKEYLAISRLVPVAEELKLKSLGELFGRLRRCCDPVVESMVCEAMVTCETSFFRNPSAFDRLKTSVFPYLLNARRSVKRLRIWSAGCSTGQEPYSIAILLLENFPEIQGWDVKIVGTDLSARALRQAEAGEYSEAETRRGLSDSLRHAYFKNKSHRWIVDPRVSRLVSFEKFNLVSSTPLSTIFDILFVRNVMIYFSSERRASLFELLRNSIRDDGFLFLGESETIIGQGDAFMFASDGMDYYQPTPR